ncbi:Uncharacterised protein [Segatella copri]|nr:Uncharacterised protein [Segatella copri]
MEQVECQYGGLCFPSSLLQLCVVSHGIDAVTHPGTSLVGGAGGQGSCEVWGVIVISQHTDASILCKCLSVRIQVAGSEGLR